MPFHDDAPEKVGRKPPAATTAVGSSSASASASSVGGGAGKIAVVDERTKRIQACEALAMKILKRFVQFY
jgi:hypothetical protein